MFLSKCVFEGSMLIFQGVQTYAVNIHSIQYTYITYSTYLLTLTYPSKKAKDV